ncbi:PKD domain-containing protein [Winogradskyella aurantiaca]|uniref:PKD domain-containing protein n=1 Tax=Winogradskyella aurantiaca TaxID=2219558 RepID=UPI0013003D33|nr:PKD domain-containing protein [Winogradskyella aurantiaca]
MMKNLTLLLVLLTASICRAQNHDETELSCFTIKGQDSIRSGQTIKFNNCSKESYFFYWDFDDGNYSFEQHPSHRFREAKIHSVTLSVQKEEFRDLNEDGEINFKDFHNAVTSSKLIQVTPKDNMDYDLWLFEGNGFNENSYHNDWNTSRIEFSDSTLISDGIYENSGDFEAERAIVRTQGLSFETHSLAIKFKPNFDWHANSPRSQPILVGGRSYRWLRINLNKSNKIQLSFNGNVRFSIPNKGLEINNLTIKPDSFNLLYLSWDIPNHKVSIAVNDEEPTIIDIPSDFYFPREWRSAKNLTIQDYSSGQAFKGEVDFVFSANKCMNPSEINKILNSYK